MGMSLLKTQLEEDLTITRVSQIIAKTIQAGFAMPTWFCPSNLGV